MSAKGIIIPPAGGKHHASATPGRFFDLKLLREQTGNSVMMFEETLPAGTASLYHLHHESDEVAWVLEGEFTFKIGDEVGAGGPGTCAFFPRNVPHAWKNSGNQPGRALYVYTPAAAGHYLEEMVEHLGRSLTEDEHRDRFRRHRWEVIGPNPL